MTEAQIRRAGLDDNEALRDIIFRSPQAGRVLLAADRSPDFFARSEPYDERAVYVAPSADGVAGTVTCALKTVNVGGRPQRAGYIFDLVVAEAARGQGLSARMLQQAEDWAREKEAGLLYAFVMAGNRAGLSAFQSFGYTSERRLVSRLYPPARVRAPEDPEVRQMEPEDRDAVRQLLEQFGSGFDLSPAEPDPQEWAAYQGYRDDLVWVFGRPPRAVLGLWDYSGISRAVPISVPLEVRAARAVVSLLHAVRLVSWRLPPPGRPLRYGLLLGAAGEVEALRPLFATAMRGARDIGLDIITVLHDPGAPPQWADAFSLRGGYHLAVKSLSDSIRMGHRPVWVDPRDL
jgi:GNAT superfamily N-acetyltransferase